jgi:hypothetical protein
MSTLKYTGVINKTKWRRSRYRKQRLIEVDGITSQETWDPSSMFPESDGDLRHLVSDTEAYRIDLIAHKYYGDQYLWWVIAVANGIVDPFRDLSNHENATPTILRIPDPALVNSLVVR